MIILCLIGLMATMFYSFYKYVKTKENVWLATYFVMMIINLGTYMYLLR